MRFDSITRTQYNKEETITTEASSPRERDSAGRSFLTAIVSDPSHILQNEK